MALSLRILADSSRLFSTLSLLVGSFLSLSKVQFPTLLASHLFPPSHSFHLLISLSFFLFLQLLKSFVLNPGRFLHLLLTPPLVSASTAPLPFRRRQLDAHSAHPKLEPTNNNNNNNNIFLLKKRRRKKRILSYFWIFFFVVVMKIQYH